MDKKVRIRRDSRQGTSSKYLVEAKHPTLGWRFVCRTMGGTWDEHSAGKGQTLKDAEKDMRERTPLINRIISGDNPGQKVGRFSRR